MKKTFLSIVLFSLLLLAMAGCDDLLEENVEPAVEEKSYDTPTILGKVSIPADSGLKGSDFYIKVIDENDNTVFVDVVESGCTFEVINLDEDLHYDILLTTKEPDSENKRSLSNSTRSSSTGYGGWLNNVVAAMDHGHDVGSIKVKPLGSIKGTVKLEGASDSGGVTVYIPGTSFLTMSNDDGSYAIPDVPQGIYVLKCMISGFDKVTVEDVSLHANTETESPVAELTEIRMVKSVGTISGKVLLEGKTDNSGTKVELLLGSSVYDTQYSNADGEYCFTVPQGNYSGIKFSKNDFSTVYDNSAISLFSGNVVSITQAQLTALSNTVKGTVEVVGAADNSGVKISFENHTDIDPITTTADGKYEFNHIPLDSYVIKFEKTGYYDSLKRVTVEVGENIDLDTIELTNTATEVSGELAGDLLTWTNTNNPYLVTGNVLVPQGKTLTIGEGVIVQFNGSYSIQVDGTLVANGTEEKKISFYGINLGQDNWLGIKDTGRNDNKLSYVNITGTYYGLQGNFAVDHSTVTINNFMGTIKNSTIEMGNCNATVIDTCTVNNSITCTNSQIKYSNLADASLNSCYLTGNTITGNQTLDYSLCENNQFENCLVNSSYTGMKNNTFTTCTVSLTNGGVYKNCNFDNCLWNPVSAAIITGCNITGSYTIATSVTKYFGNINMKNNYWGSTNTAELELKHKDDNANYSFITDYYDLLGETTIIDVSVYKTASIGDCGYKGSSYYSSNEDTGNYSIGGTGPAGGIVFYDKGYYSEGWRYLEAAPEDITTDNIFGFYKNGDDTVAHNVGTGLFVGNGKLNTELLLEAMPDNAYKYNSLNDFEKTTNYAVKACSDYDNGYTDWFMPSRDELELMYTNLHYYKIGNFSNEAYFASTEYATIDDNAWTINFWFNIFGCTSKGNTLRVRPIRAF